VKAKLTEVGVNVFLEERGNPGRLGEKCFALTATTTVLEEEAESRGFLKLSVEGVMDDFAVAVRDNFVGIDSPDFFSQGERADLVWSRVDFVRADDPQIRWELDKVLAVFDRGDSRETLRHVLEANGLVDCVAPIHDERTRDELMYGTIGMMGDHSFFSPISQLRNYYSEEIAFYFLWMDFFTTWLCIPAAAALLLFAIRMYRGDSVDTCDITPFFGFFMFLWGVAFIRFWERHEARQAWEWGTYLRQGESGLDVRPQFKGNLRRSPVTGRMEQHYPFELRLGKYVVSVAVTVLLLLGAFCVMIASLNFQGYIQPAHDRPRWPQDADHPFHIKAIAAYAEPGAVFDPSSTLGGIVPVVTHVGAILMLNSGYSKIAGWLTRWENHKSVLAHQNSLILKRFLFEAFDAFIGLFYLAFYENDVLKLRSELVAVFNVDTFRRVFCECLLPMAVHWLTRKIEQRKSAATPQPETAKETETEKEKEKEKEKEHEKRDEEPMLGTEGGDGDVDVGRRDGDGKVSPGKEAAPNHERWSGHRLSNEADLDEYDQFDDYLEMVVEFGYVTLFASAYPLASVLAVAANLVEVRSDALKLAHVTRKPRAIRASSIGMWRSLIGGVVWLSALSNCLIFGFTSQQMMQWLPSFFVIAEDGDQELAAGKGRFVVTVVFVLERTLLLLGLLVYFIVPAVPEDVAEKIEAREWVRAQAARKLRLQRLNRAVGGNDDDSGKQRSDLAASYPGQSAVAVSGGSGLRKRVLVSLAAGGQADPL
jgi:anoctamin-8